MNWKVLFKTADILTAADRAELERLEDSTKQLRDLAARIDRDFPDAGKRQDRIRELAEQLCERPDDADLYRQLQVTACMPSNPATGYQHRDLALGAIHGAIAARMIPAADVVRRVLRRALEAAEGELKKTEGRERRDAEQEGYNYSPSGRVQALQQRVLQLRNEIASKYSQEGAIVGPPSWRERLAEWL